MSFVANFVCIISAEYDKPEIKRGFSDKINKLPQNLYYPRSLDTIFFFKTQM